MRHRASSAPLLLAAFAILLPTAAAASSAGWSADFHPAGPDAAPICALETAAGLVVGGGFTAIGDVACNRIALFDGAAWQPLGDGFNATVHFLVEFDGRLVAAGGFTASGGTPLSHVAWWDGVSWQPLGDDLPAGDRGLVVYEGALHSGGWRWNGAAWDRIMTSNASIVVRLVFNGLLVFTGGFSEVNGVPAQKIAAWDGESVSTPYPGTWLGPIIDLEMYGNQLVALEDWGDDGAEVPITTWDGDAWVSLNAPGSGYNPYYTSLTVSGDSLYAARMIWDGLHPVSSSSLYAWDGEAWSGTAVSTDGVFDFLAPCRDGVLLCGGFTSIGDVAAHHLAALVNGEIVTFDRDGQGFDGPVSDFAVGESGLLACGIFRSVAGVISPGVIQNVGNNWIDRGLDLGSVASNAALTVGWAGTTPVVQGVYYSDYTGYYFNHWQGSGWDDLVIGWDGDPVLEFQRLGDRLFGVTQSKVFEILGGGLLMQQVAAASGGEIMTAGSWNDRLVVGGTFDHAAGLPASCLASFDGTTWSAVAPGLAGSVTALTAWNGLLVAAGDLSVDGSARSVHMAVWDGAAWSDLAGDFDGAIESLAVYRGILYAGGEFTAVGGTTVNHLARWGGGSWQPVDGGVTGGHWCTVHDLAVHDGLLWVGGWFDRAGGRLAQNVCAWFDPTVAVFLQELRAAREAGGVRVSWTVSDEGGEFRLERIEAGGRVEVTLAAGTGVRHEVLDASAPDGECRYVLSLAVDGAPETILGEVLVPTAVPMMLRLATPAPNPFNPSTRIAFSLPHPGRATVTVHDLLGRRVATLLDEDLAAGGQETTWHGCDDAGRDLASGSYLVRLRLGDAWRTVRAVLVR